MQIGNKAPSPDYTKAPISPHKTSSPPKSAEEIQAVAALVTRLLSHYWATDEHPESRRAQMMDWIEDLIEFGADCVADACREWRQTQNRRPTPADIRKLCGAQQYARYQEALRQLPPPPAPPPPPEVTLEERHEIAQRLGELAEMMRGERHWPDGTVSAEPARKHFSRAAVAALAAARESRIYDPEALRRDRIALGLEAAEAAE